MIQPKNKPFPEPILQIDARRRRSEGFGLYLLFNVKTNLSNQVERINLLKRLSLKKGSPQLSCLLNINRISAIVYTGSSMIVRLDYTWLPGLHFILLVRLLYSNRRNAESLTTFSNSTYHNLSILLFTTSSLKQILDHLFKKISVFFNFTKTIISFKKRGMAINSKEMKKFTKNLINLFGPKAILGVS